MDQASAAPHQSSTRSSNQPKVAQQPQAGRSRPKNKYGPRFGRHKGSQLAVFFRSIRPPRALQLWQTLRGYKILENKKTPIRKLSFSASLKIGIHLLAIFAAIVIVVLNFNGLWVGKELPGQSGRDGVKLLALQFVAKLHELLMLASLGHILFSINIRQLLFGDGLPLAAVTAALRFSDISYLLSAEFLATCVTTFSSKFLVLPVIVIFTCLGVLVGPSSATAMRPMLADWSGGATSFWLNATAQDLWPSDLSLSSTETYTCTTTPEACGGTSTWNTLANNFFTYWGREALEEIRAMPESVQISGRVSVRTLNVRFRGASTLYQPLITTATIQQAAIADAVNQIRQIWFRENQGRCSSAEGRRRSQFCTYRDITWSAKAAQPAVYVACHGSSSTTVPLFPTLAHGLNKPDLIEYAVNISGNGSSSTSSIKWVNLIGPAFTHTSIGALVRPAYPKRSNSDDVYACSVEAQWANATIQSSFVGLPYIVNGVPPDWFQREISASQYHGRRVSISPGWAALANPPLTAPSQNTINAFDKLLIATNSSGATNDLAQKIEAVLAVLLADRMARINGIATIEGNITNIDQVLEPNGAHVFAHPPPSSSYHAFSLDTAVTGYAFGLRTASGIESSTLIANLILLLYATIGTSYVVYMVLFSRWDVNAWEGMTELLVLALHSDVAGVEAMRNTSAGIETIGPLKTGVVFVARDGHVEMVLGEDGCEGEGKGIAARKEERVMRDTSYS